MKAYFKYECFFLPKSDKLLKLAFCKPHRKFLITLSSCLAQPKAIISEDDKNLESRTNFVGGLSKTPSLTPPKNSWTVAIRQVTEHELKPDKGHPWIR